MAEAHAELWEDPLITKLKLEGKRIAARNAAYKARRAGEPRGEPSCVSLTAAPRAQLPFPPLPHTHLPPLPPGHSSVQTLNPDSAVLGVHGPAFMMSDTSLPHVPGVRETAASKRARAAVAFAALPQSVLHDILARVSGADAARAMVRVRCSNCF